MIRWFWAFWLIKLWFWQFWLIYRFLVWLIYIMFQRRALNARCFDGRSLWQVLVLSLKESCSTWWLQDDLFLACGLRIKCWKVYGQMINARRLRASTDLLSTDDATLVQSLISIAQQTLHVR